jgi:site-specific recombinase XerC
MLLGPAPADNQPPARRRDAALVAVAYACGLQRAELVALDVEDYDRETGRLRVVGKGNKERAAFVRNGAKDALHAWLRVRGDLADDVDDDIDPAEPIPNGVGDRRPTLCPGDVGGHEALARG